MSYKYVAVIGIDGMGAYNKNTETPCMDEIFKNAASTYKALSMDPTISAENWGAMLIGASPLVHTLTNSKAENEEYNNPALPTIFKRIRQAMPEAYLASVCGWKPLNSGIVENNIGVDKRTAENDEKLCPLAEECIAKKPVLLFVQFNDTDGAGHGWGYGSKKHYKAIKTADKLIGRIYNAYKAAGIFDDTFFIITADHGGYIRSHGGYSEKEKYVFLGAAGKGVKKRKIKFARTKDVAAIVLYALGLPIPQYDDKGFSSQIPNGIFDGAPEYMIKEAHESQIDTRETPGNLFDFFPKEKFKLALYLDNSLDDATGKCTLCEKGAVKFYSNAVNGGCAEFGSVGCAKVDGASFGTDNFTISLWLKIERSLKEPAAVVCNKSLENDRYNGFALALRSDDIVFNIGSGSNFIETFIPFPEDISSGWIHNIISVDQKNHNINFFTNFVHMLTLKLKEDFWGTLEAEKLTIGNDSDEEFNNIKNSLTLRADDIFIFDFAFSEKDVGLLKDYYGLSV